MALVKTTVAGLRRGQMVRSLAGRDQGQEFFIVGFLGDHLLLLANGRERPITRPKKKNIRHVEVYLWVDPLIEARMNNGESITDEDIRNSLTRRQKELEEGA